MARKSPKLGADGLPEALPIRPVFKPLSMVLGAFAGFAIILFMQQSGQILLTTTWIAVGIVAGMLLGIALPSLPYMLVARRVNHAVADERKKRAAANAAPAPMASPEAPMGAP